MQQALVPYLVAALAAWNSEMISYEKDFLKVRRIERLWKSWSFGARDFQLYKVMLFNDDWKHLGKKFVGPQVAAFLPLVQVGSDECETNWEIILDLFV